MVLFSTIVIVIVVDRLQENKEIGLSELKEQIKINKNKKNRKRELI